MNHYYVVLSLCHSLLVFLCAYIMVYFHRFTYLFIQSSIPIHLFITGGCQGVGHTCEEAEDGAQAVQKVQERLSAQDINSSSGRRNEGSSCSSNNSSSNNSPSASPRPSPCFHGILMDFVMPVMDGPDATKGTTPSFPPPPL